MRISELVEDAEGTTGLYVAADAMRFWRQASCGDAMEFLVNATSC